MLDLSGPFRGSAAVTAGLLTWNVLRGSRFRRLFPDIYVPSVVEPTLALRSRAAALLVGERGVLAGYSAAELLGASCGPADAPAELLALPVHGVAGAPADARSESPMESRVRMALVLGGRVHRLDLAHPSARLGVEYDGELHRTQERARRELAREAALAAAGWTLLRFVGVRDHEDRVSTVVPTPTPTRSCSGQ